MQEDITIGLDVSTTFTGITILENQTKTLRHIDALKFKNCKTIFDKVDFAKKYFQDLKIQPARLVIEEPLMGFSKGASSAKTITTAFKFNGMISYVAREVFGLDPAYVSAAHARNVCGLKMQQKKKCGKPHKLQAFEQLMATDLRHLSWPLKKSKNKSNPKPVDWAYDCTDSYVIAKCGLLEQL